MIKKDATASTEKLRAFAAAFALPKPRPAPAKDTVS
jgi:hypothetical protein